ncbi:glycosyl hydrolase 115 family protein [Sphingobium sp. H39-3-25]|uniref:glycosyl hydrolase 115 family protein n=1 Tax=Sphingobium arseniciresistens TaxID=3030834 RepID=UPI0023B9B7E2|nr:glycosyl hydrolase 115 family protein [Sphingobium arseniciresistens]
MKRSKSGLLLLRALLPVLVLGFAPAPANAEGLLLFDGHRVARILHDGNRPLSIAGNMLAGDLLKLTGNAPSQSSDLRDCGTLCIVIGQRGSPLIEAVAKDTGLDLAPLKGQWERYMRVSLPSRSQPSRHYLVIAGSDMRGAIWGTVDLTREMGVSAWEWWADISPRRTGRLVVDGAYRLSATPSVQYRGIFLNDEDWGLQPWAAKTFEPETGDIGPKTYARIFELMWRLKANLIWPAMHDVTKPFYQIAGNAETARDYAIVVGTSHAEPMMRNNVREWDEKRHGDFNFFTNREAMIRYWRDRVTQVKPFENVYTVGLRGKHDSEMEGARTPEIARDALGEAIAIQRDLLAKAQNKPADQVPQALTLYKEVRDLYGLGLKVPDDITLVWPEDNYGYINQLSTPQEQARSGGSGVYYHISYWGRPHDYLWLATTHPALIREQMDRAWQMKARKIWMLNVGDIKPAEYLTQYFLDLAFDHEQFGPPARNHLRKWLGQQFDPALAPRIADIMTEYYDLAFERRPEFMGFSTVEPTSPIAISDYIRTGGREAQQRIDRYADLSASAEALAAEVPADRTDAFFQLVLYPVRAAASLNERNLKLDLAALYARQGWPNANLLTEQAEAAHERIIADTARYNAQNGGKWRGMMSMAPRELPVFARPTFPKADAPRQPGCVADASELNFIEGRKGHHFLTIHSWGEPAEWQLSGQHGLALTTTRGRLEQANGYQQRIALTYDGSTSPVNFGALSCAGKTKAIGGAFIRAATGDVPVEIDRTISLTAVMPTSPSSDWERVEGLGSRQAALRSKLSLPSRKGTQGIVPLRYDFETTGTTDAEVRIIALPAHPLTSANGLRLGVQIDDAPIQILDYETHGRSEEWKRNVLSNMAQRRSTIQQLAKGKHSLKIHALDPGFLLDRIDVRLDGAPDPYGAPPIL